MFLKPSVASSHQPLLWEDPIFSYPQAALDLPILLFGCSLFIFIAGFFFFPSAKSLNDWFYFIVTPLTLLNAKKINWHVFQKDALVLLFLAYLTYCSFTDFWSSSLSMGKLFKPFVQSLVLVVFFLSIQLTRHLPKSLLKSFVEWFFWISALSATISIYMWYAHNPWGSSLFGFFRATHPILSDWVYGIPILIAMHGLMTHSFSKKTLLRSMLAIPSLMYILLTQSRGPVVALVAAIFLLLLYYRNLRALGILLLLLAVIGFDHTLVTRSFDTVFFRQAIWKTVFSTSLEHPLLGHGYMAKLRVETINQVFSHAHNVYLEIFYLGGVVGFLLQSLLIIFALVRAWQHRESRIMNIITAIFIFGLLCLTTDGDRLVENPRELWINFWLPLFAIMAYTSSKPDPYRLK